VTVIDGESNTTATIPAGTEPWALAVNPVTNKIYVTNARYLEFYPTGIAAPAASVINFGASQTRANNAVVQLNSTGEMTVYAGLASGSVHVIMDVNGFFE
jgi:DNA-binding beta-propeller fold protein YncE